VYEEITYKLDLCEPHAASFDRDMDRWIIVAGKAVTPFGTFTPEQRAENQRIADLRQKEQDLIRAAEEQARRDQEERAREMTAHARQNIVPGADDWLFTPHARQRAEERGFSETEVLRAVTRPRKVIRQPWRGSSIVIHQVQDCRVVLDDRDKRIITVIDRRERTETTDPNARRAL
jgi:hypothetical protein